MGTFSSSNNILGNKLTTTAPTRVQPQPMFARSEQLDEDQMRKKLAELELENR